MQTRSTGSTNKKHSRVKGRFKV